MNTAPATSAIGANVPPPSPLNPVQPSEPGTTSTFQDVYQNLPAMQDQSQDDGKPAANGKSDTIKKKSPGGDDPTVPSPVNARLSTSVLPKALLTLTASLGLPGQPGSQTPQADASGASSSTATQSTGDASASENLVSAGANAVSTPDLAQAALQLLDPGASAVGGNPSEQAATPPAPAQTLLSGTLASSQEVAIDVTDRSRSDTQDTQQAASKTSKVPALPASRPVAKLPVAITASTPQNPDIAKTASSVETRNIDKSLRLADSAAALQKQASPDSSMDVLPQHTNTVTSPVPSGSFSLSAQNLAFSLQWSQAAGNANGPEAPGFDAPASPSRDEKASDSEMAAQLTQPAAAPRSIAIPPTAVDEQPPEPPADSKILVTSTTTPARVLPNNNVTDSTNVAKPEAASHRPASNEQAANHAEPPDDSPATVHQVPTGSTQWLSAVAHVDTRLSANVFDPPAPVRSSVAAPLQEIQQPILDTPRTTPSSEILLHLGNGDTSAAVRVVDRAGTVNVSVHATDPELRTSLRSNLNELTTQLNTQGLKTEAIKTVSPQSAAENRQEQGGQEQRPSSQQQPSYQNDRQSQRDRRTQSAWLDELEQQTSAPAGNSRGDNS